MESPEDMVRRVAKNIASIEDDHLGRTIYEVMKQFDSP